MSFFKKRENIILSALVLGFFLIIAVWHDVGGIRSGLFSSANGANVMDVVFVDGNDQPRTLAEFKGKPLIVNFWATWCPVCVKKMDTLNKFAGQFEAAGGQVLAISNDQTGIGSVKAFYIRNGYENLPIYMDTRGQLMHDFGARGLPTAALISAEGEVLGLIEGGFDWTSSQAYGIIKEKFGLTLN